MLQTFTPAIESEAGEQRELTEVLRDRAELLERMAGMSRQVDALTRRAMEISPSIELREVVPGPLVVAPEAAALPAPAPAKRKPPRTRRQQGGKGTKRTRSTKSPKSTGPVVPRRAQRQAVPTSEVQVEVLAFLGTREVNDPASPAMIAEGIGRDRYQVDKAIAKCNGQLAKVVVGRGPNPSFYLRSDQLPAESWPHTANEARAQSVPEWLNELEERQGAVKRRGEGLRGTGPIIGDLEAQLDDDEKAERDRVDAAVASLDEDDAGQVDVDEEDLARAAGPVPVMSARTRRALADERTEPPAPVDPADPLEQRIMTVLRNDGPLKVSQVAQLLDEDPAAVAREMRDHQKFGNIERQDDGSFRALDAVAF